MSEFQLSVEIQHSQNKKLFEIEMPRRKRKGKTVKKNQSSSTGPDGDKDERTKAPHSFVIHRGKTGKYVQDLTNDVRKVMEPYTATNLKVRKLMSFLILPFQHKIHCSRLN